MKQKRFEKVYRVSYEVLEREPEIYKTAENGSKMSSKLLECLPLSPNKQLITCAI